MKKKLHKTGTTILLALAPACALGVVGGIALSSLNQGDVERTLELTHTLPAFITDVVTSELTTKSTKLDLTFNNTIYYADKMKFHLENEKGKAITEPVLHTLQYPQNTLTLDIPENALKSCKSVTLVSETILWVCDGTEFPSKPFAAEYTDVTSKSTSVSVKVHNDTPMAITYDFYITPNKWSREQISKEKLRVTIPGSSYSDFITFTFDEGALKDAPYLALQGNMIS